MKNQLVKLLLILNYSLFYSPSLISQENLPPGAYTTSNKKAIKKHEEGRKNFESKKDKEAEQEFLRAIEIDPNFTEPHIALGYLYADHAEYPKSIEHFQRAVELSPKLFVNCFYDLGGLYIATGNYQKAKDSYDSFLSFSRINPNLKEKATHFLKCAEFGIEALKNPKPFNPVNMGPSINSPDYEYFPAITSDGLTFLFTRNIRSVSGTDSQEDFFVSEWKNTNWEPAKTVPVINTSWNEGAPTLSSDGNYLFYTACQDPLNGFYGNEKRKGFGSCDIFFSQKIKERWTEPINIGTPVNSANWESQPSFSSDGKTLYFIRGFMNRNNEREQDIYMSVVGSDGKFGEPVKLGPNVNTSGKEESVFIHPDNNTLYFSSSGHVGMGGLDIFMSKKQADGSWGKAINLGYPINSNKDENSLLVDPSGKLAYFASDRDGGFGGLDIYKFDLPEEFKPEEITYMKGRVFDAKTKEGLAAEFELIDLETQKKIMNSYSTAEGNFLVTLNTNKNYLLNVSRQGYLFYSDNFSLKDVKSDFNHPFIMDVPLQKMDTGNVIELKNIFFDLNKSDLRPESLAELNKLINFLSKNAALKVEIGGHTDNTGERKSNITLSEERAKTVMDYLVQKGSIDKSRLSFRGYADLKPKVPNDTPENRSKNRRTEMKITGK